MPKVYAEVAGILPRFSDCLNHDNPESVVNAVKAKGRLVSFLHDSTHAPWKESVRIQTLIKSTLAELNQHPPHGREFEQFQALKHAFRSEYEAFKAQAAALEQAARVAAAARAAREQEARRQAEQRRMEEERRRQEEVRRAEEARQLREQEEAQRQAAIARFRRILVPNPIDPMFAFQIQLEQERQSQRRLAEERRAQDQEQITITIEVARHRYNPRNHLPLWTSERWDIIGRLLAGQIEPPAGAAAHILRHIRFNGGVDLARDFLHTQAAKSARDEEGLTIFHIACLYGWQDIIAECITQNPLNPAFFRRDNQNRTAVGCCLSSPVWQGDPDTMRNALKIMYGPPFLNLSDAFFAGLPNGNAFRQHLEANPRLILSSNPFHHAFILGSERLGQSLCHLMTRKTFEDHFLHFDGFPADEVAAFHDNILYTAVRQMQGNRASSGGSQIPPPPSGIELTAMNELFGKINFTKPQEPNYYNPCKRFEYNQTEDPQEALGQALESLNTLIGHLSTNNLNGLNANSIKYQEMRMRLLHILGTLSKLDLVQNTNNSPPPETIRKNHALLLETMTQFVNAGTHCAPRVYNTILEQYEKVVQGRSSFSDSVTAELADLRRLFLQGFLPSTHENILRWVSIVNAFGRLFPHLALPEGQALSELHDSFSNNGMELDAHEAAEIGNKVQNAYTPAAILDRLYGHIEDSEQFRDQFRDFYIENVLTQCASEKYGANWATRTPEWASHNLPRNWAETIPEDYHIELPTAQRVEAYRKKLFLQDEFEDRLLDPTTGKMKREALACALQYLGILEETQFLS
jgi:hypothetical protein